MKFNFQQGALALSMVVISLPALALNTPPMPSSPATSPIPSTIMVHPPVAAGGQWFDTYFPSNPGGLDGTVIANTTCIVVYYHGGSFSDAATPRGNENNIGTEMPKHYVQNQGCILIAASYSGNPSSGPINTVGEIIGTPSTNQSVIGSFNALYTQFLQGWMQSNPNIRLWTVGESAGTIPAQRVAASGLWPVTQTLLISPVVRAPTYVSWTTPGNLPVVSPLGTDVCDTRYTAEGCAQQRSLFGWSAGDWAQNWAQNDLAYYAASTPASVKTNVVFNGCDDFVDLGSFMRGYFNSLSPSSRKISVHRGFSRQGILDLNKVEENPYPDYRKTQHSANGKVGTLYLQNYTNTSPPSSDWLAFNSSNLPEIDGKYIGYCQPPEDGPEFRSFLIN